MPSLIRLLSLVFCVLVQASCANTTTSKYSFTDGAGRKGSIELPKDIQAEGLDIKTATGARIKIKKLNAAGNVEQTKAQGEREAAAAGKISEGLAEGVVKGIKGF
jgi:hypothetical protein